MKLKPQRILPWKMMSDENQTQESNFLKQALTYNLLTIKIVRFKIIMFSLKEFILTINKWSKMEFDNRINYDDYWPRNNIRLLIDKRRTVGKSEMSKTTSKGQFSWSTNYQKGRNNCIALHRRYVITPIYWWLKVSIFGTYVKL